MVSSPSSAAKSNGPSASTITRVNERIEEIRLKEKEIWETLDEPNIDLWKLRELCLTKDGLISDRIRQKVWPILVGLNTDLSSLHISSTRESQITSDVRREIRDKIAIVDPTSVKTFTNQSMARSVDAEQIDRDVARCTWHLLTGSQRMRSRQMRNKHRKKVADLLKKKQVRLGNLINLTLIHSYQGITNEEDKFRYFQGYHDVASIFLSTLGGIVSPYASDKSSTSVCTTVAAAMRTAEAMGLYLPAQVLLKVSRSHFRDALRQNFQLLTAALKLTIMPLIKTLDVKVFNHLRECEMEPFFALSWILTWFSHDVRETALVKRLFDVFIASHPLMPIYMAVAMVLHPINRLEILSTECDFSSLHSALSQLPRKSSPVGWRFVGSCDGGGYVSGDENEDECISKLDQSDSKSWEENSIGSRDLDDEDSFAPSLASTSLWSSVVPVPVSFEEIIELSIHFMRRIPPRKLMFLARSFAHEEGEKLPLDEASIISLFKQPPLWATASKTPSLQSIKIQIPVSTANSVRYRKKRKVHGEPVIDSAPSLSADKDEAKCSPGKEVSSFALIAAGLGPDGDGDKRRRRRARKLMMTLSVLALFAFTTCYWLIPLQVKSTFRIQNILDSDDFTIIDDHQENSVTSTTFNSELVPMDLAPLPVTDTCPMNLAVEAVEDSNFLGVIPTIELNTFSDASITVSTTREKSVIWKSSLQKIFGNHLFPPKIDPVKVFHAFTKFVQVELSKIFRLDRKRGNLS